MAINIRGLDKVKLVQALYGRAKSHGMGFLSFMPGGLTTTAAALLVQQGFMDYVSGRVMKISVDGDFMDEGLYDRDNGYGAAQEAVDDVLEEMTRP